MDDGDPGEQIAESSISYGETFRDFRLNDFSFFAADDWKINSKLTLNLGFRYDLFGWPSEANGLIPNYDLSRVRSSADIGSGYIFASNLNPSFLPNTPAVTLSETKSTLSTDYNNFAPRIGFAFSPLANSRLVIRGGYGFYYDRPTGGFLTMPCRVPRQLREQELNDVSSWNTIPRDRPTFPLPRIPGGFRRRWRAVSRRSTADDPDEEFEALEAHMMDLKLRIPYIQQWNFGVQLPVSTNSVLDVG